MSTLQMLGQRLPVNFQILKKHSVSTYLIDAKTAFY